MILYSPANAFERASVEDWMVTSVRKRQVMQNNRDSQFDREVFNFRIWFKKWPNSASLVNVSTKKKGFIYVKILLQTYKATSIGEYLHLANTFFLKISPKMCQFSYSVPG